MGGSGGTGGGLLVDTGAGDLGEGDGDSAGSMVGSGGSLVSRQCKGCHTGKSLRRQGAVQRGGPHRWGHSPIAGETLANGAIEEASSPWADTGLAQGARPLSQRSSL